VSVGVVQGHEARGREERKMEGGSEGRTVIGMHMGKLFETGQRGEASDHRLR
jgi:hypothetical protein